MATTIDPAALYITDNGAILCGAHLGACAKSTGRDLSGEAIQRVADSDRIHWRHETGKEMQCETCEAQSQREGSPTDERLERIRLESQDPRALPFFKKDGSM